MADPYTIRIFVPDGNPESVKVVDLLNWTGVGVAFPRSEWPAIKHRPEFDCSGVYILSGAEEGVTDELPTIYVGQGDEIRQRFEKHFKEKTFWDWGYAFVSRSNALNRAHITWLESALVKQATAAKRCHLNNKTEPRRPRLSETDEADTRWFLREVLRILPVLGVRVFEKPVPITRPQSDKKPSKEALEDSDHRDTIVVPAQIDGFHDTFIAQNCWHAIRIGGGMLPKIKHIAAYQTAPVSAITHCADVDRIEPYGDEGKYKVVFSAPAEPLSKPIPFGNAPMGSMQSCRYTSMEKLLTAKDLTTLWS